MAIYKTLEELRAEKYANNKAAQSGYFSHVYKVKPPKSAAQLESLIDEYCTLSKAECTIIYSGGRQLVSKTHIVDVLGRKNSITNSKFIPGTTRNGTSDIIVVKNNKALYVECKFSKSDRQSENQKQWQKRVEGFGNTYVIVRTLKEFITIFNEWK